MQKLDAYIDGVPHLPPAPTLVVELLNLFKEPDRDLDQVVDLISHEPVLTARVLKQCNSAYFAAEEPVTDMFEAVTRLGFYEVYCLVVGVFGSRTLASPDPACCLSPDTLWHHSVSVAAASAALAQQIGAPHAAAFTTGLLHDLGKLILASAEPVTYAPLLQAAAEPGFALIQAEQAAFGADHARLGARLLERWKLPPEVVAAVRWHHQPREAGEHLRLAATIHLADALTYRLEETASCPCESMPGAEETCSLLGLRAEDMAGIQSEARQAVQRIKELMGVAA